MQYPPLRYYFKRVLRDRGGISHWVAKAPFQAQNPKKPKIVLNYQKSLGIMRPPYRIQSPSKHEIHPEMQFQNPNTDKNTHPCSYFCIIWSVFGFWRCIFGCIFGILRFVFCMGPHDAKKSLEKCRKDFIGDLSQTHGESPQIFLRSGCRWRMVPG